MGNILVARQPILSRSKRTLGYELLFRAAATDETASIIDGDAATATVITNTLTEIGLDGIIGQSLAFVNVTAHFLTQPHLLDMLPPDRCVLEVLEDTVVTNEVVAGVESLVERGFMLALDDFSLAGPTAPLLPYASYVKYDYSEICGEPLLDAIMADQDANRRVVVERIETEDQYAAAALAGADYFQGYFFARPAIMSATNVTANSLTLMRLLARINMPDATIDDIVEVLTQDVAMSVKALKYVNSAALGFDGRVDSIRRAAVLVGRETLRSWTTLEVMSSLGSKPSELIRMALVRARFCEIVARRRGLEDPESFYTVGMLSLLDALTDTPMNLFVERISLSNEMQAALLGHDSPYTDVLKTAVAIEQQTADLAAALADDGVIADHREATASVNRFLAGSVPVPA